MDQAVIDRLAELAATQHGVFASWHARALGMSREQMRRRTGLGFYRRIAPKVYRINGAPHTFLTDVATAVFSVGPRAAASHQTACIIHDLTPRRGPAIEVVVRRWRREHRDFVVHESLDLSPADIMTVDGVPTTTVARSLVDLGASAPGWLVAACLDTALRIGKTTLGEVDRFVDRVSRKGRRGVGVIRPLLEERHAWVGSTESPLEDMFRRLITEAGLPPPVPQFEVSTPAGRFVCRADFAYPKERLLIEVDGYAYHADPGRFQRDRTVQNEVELMGWQMLRYTWDDLVAQPWLVVQQIKSVLA